ncbi:hypothetical protein AAHA92_27066 [Salvia divinorum]|uniref:Agglutinin domain-containing protein n=1 Tax=Salvia divinorum TaxID=28513 RepID=A0ABD1G2L1_SALDI
MTSALPNSIVIVINTNRDTYVYRKDSNGSVWGGIDSPFSPLVKIQVERAKADNDHIHLRFTHNNKYWQKNMDTSSIVAISNKLEEDTGKPSCTLFKLKVESDVFYLTHAHTGMSVMFDNSNGVLYLQNYKIGSPLRFLDAETLVKLPKHVAFKAVYIDKYLKAEYYKDNKYLRFASSDPNELASGNEVSLMSDGHVLIKSDYYGLFWRQTSSWIATDTDDVTANNKDTLFWPFDKLMF